MGLRIAIGSDHGGFAVKSTIARHLAERGHHVIDCGTYTAESADYPVYAWKVAGMVSGGAADRGVLLCRSGNGVAIVANKRPGVRAGFAVTPETARLAVGHNECNIVVIGCDHTKYPVEELVDAFLSAEPEGGRHHRRVRQIMGFDRLLESALATDKMALAGQSTWLLDAPENLQPDRTLESLVLFGGVRGLLVRVAAIAQALANGRGNYAARLAAFRQQAGTNDALCLQLKIADARDAADVLRPVYDITAGDDGYVALELDVRLDRDEAGLAERVRQLVNEIDRPNIMVALPATAEGLRALRLLTARGFSTAVLHLFSPAQFRAAADAYLAGLRDSLAAGLSIHDVRSVAALSIRPLAEAIGRALIAEGTGRQTHADERLALETVGTPAALALAAQLHHQFRQTFLTPAFNDEFARHGGAPQRLLWLDAPHDDQVHPHFPAESLAAPFTVACLSMDSLQMLLERPRTTGEGLVSALSDDAPRTDGLQELQTVDLDALDTLLLEQQLARGREEQQALLQAIEAGKPSAIDVAKGTK
ncbi:MAG: transaldolase [Candidatus Sumerlaeota bacterium]|nr:transaldolase [Candidatus Sumerlaeota bacterium]